MRQQKQKALCDIQNRNRQVEGKCTEDNRVKQGIREQMYEMERRMRELQREIAATHLENEGLKAVLSGEQELRDERDNEETNVLVVVNDDLKQNFVVCEEEKRKAKKQKEVGE